MANTHPVPKILQDAMRELENLADQLDFIAGALGHSGAQGILIDLSNRALHVKDCLAVLIEVDDAKVDATASPGN